MEVVANKDRRALPSGEREVMGLMELRMAIDKNEKKSEVMEMVLTFLIWSVFLQLFCACLNLFSDSDGGLKFSNGHHLQLI